MTDEEIIALLEVIGRFKQYREACDEGIEALKKRMRIGAKMRMTNEKAKQYILANYFDGDDDVKAVVDGDDETLAMAKAVEALDKQIPKIATRDARCPVCGELLFVEGRVLLPVCPCGQKILWS